MLTISCLAFTLAYAAEIKNTNNMYKKTKIININKKHSIQKQQREIKNSLKRMENKMKKRRAQNQRKDNNGNI